MLPTPVADNSRGLPQPDSDYQSLPNAAVALLPTPAVNDMGRGKTLEQWDEWTDRMKAAHGNGNGHGKRLEIEAQRLLPTPNTKDGMSPRSDEALERAKLVGGCSNLKDTRELWSGSFGSYMPAVRRWEAITGRDAPPPTTSSDGGARLNPLFVEWMMGLPEGHVTDSGAPATQQFKLLGNGVVPQQAALALQHLDPQEDE